MKDSKIEWCDHTFNPWSGCTKVSPGCAHCYAESLSKRTGSLGKWGHGAERKRTGVANWLQPVLWNKKAARCVHLITKANCPYCCSLPRPRVFCASLADWLDDEVPAEWLSDLLDLIHQTPNLDWLLLTKRPQNFLERMRVSRLEPRHWHGWRSDWLAGYPPKNIWIGTTVEDQQRADERIPLLRQIPAAVRFLSCEPLLGPVNLFTAATIGGDVNEADPRRIGQRWLDWVICGGESGPGSRPMHPDWARSLRDQCAAADVPYFFKQWGHFRELDPVGKKAAGRLLDGVEHNAFPGEEVPHD